MASMSTFGIPSRSPSSSTRQGSANTLARWYSSKSSDCVKRAEEAHPVLEPGLAATRARTSCSWSPDSPAMTASKSTPRWRSTAQASTNVSRPFFRTSRPTASRRTRGRLDAAHPRRDQGLEVGVEAVVDDVHRRP